MQLPFCPVGVDVAIGHDRDGARPLVESKIVPVSGGIGVTPLRRAGERIERFHDFLVADAMEQDDTVLGNRGPAQPLPDLFPPDDARPGRWPLLVERANIDTVTGRPEELRPVGGEEGYGEEKGEKKLALVSPDR